MKNIIVSCILKWSDVNISYLTSLDSQLHFNLFSDVNISFLATWFTVALTLLLTSYFIASWFTVAFQLMWRQSFIPCLLIHSWLWSYSDINFSYFFWRQHFTLDSPFRRGKNTILSHPVLPHPKLPIRSPRLQPQSVQSRHRYRGR